MNILIVKLSSFGDILHSVPAVRLLVQGLKPVRVDWVTQPEYVELVGCVPGITRVIPFPRKQFIKGFSSFRHEIREQEYDLVVDLQGLLKSAIASYIAKGSDRGIKRLGPSFAREGSRRFYHDMAMPATEGVRHAVDRCLDTVSHLGLPLEPVGWNLSVPDHPLEKAGLDIAFLPCSRHKAKDWPAEHFIELGRNILAKRPEARIHLIGGPGNVSDCDFIANEIAKGSTNVVTKGIESRTFIHAGKTSMVELGGLLKKMDRFVTCDSGPMHLAVAVGTPIVALFGPTDPEKTGPYPVAGQDINVLRGVPQAASYKSGDQTSMSTIEVETVLSALGIAGMS